MAELDNYEIRGEDGTVPRTFQLTPEEAKAAGATKVDHPQKHIDVTKPFKTVVAETKAAGAPANKQAPAPKNRGARKPAPSKPAAAPAEKPAGE